MVTQPLQSKIQELLPGADQRQTILKAFSESVQKAENSSPENWIVRQRETNPILNVRERVVFRILEGKIRLSLDHKTLKAEEINPSEKFDRWETIKNERYPEYKNPSALNGYYTLLPEDEDWPEVQRLHFAYLDRLAKEGQKLREDKQSHDPTIIEFLNENVEDFTMNAQTEFTWIPYFTELGEKLKEYHNKTDKLVPLLDNIDNEITEGLIDNSTKEKLNFLDPFTFLASILRFGEEKRFAFFKSLKKDLEIEAEVPQDFKGVPNPTQQNFWYFPNSGKRRKQDVALLWELFENAIDSSPIQADVFNDALNIYKVKLSKLTQGLFFFNPHNFLPIDPNTSPYLKQHFNLKPDGIKDFQSYQDVLGQLREKTDQPFYKISSESYSETKGQVFSNKKIWRLGTSDGRHGTAIWPEMETNSHASIGWPKLGDLRQYQQLNKNTIQTELLKEHYEDKRTASRKAGEIFNFFKKAKEGDIVIACNGKEVKGIGEIKGGYQFNDSFDFPHIREAEWYFTNPGIQFNVGLRETFKQIKEDQIPDEIRSLIQKNARHRLRKRFIEKNRAKNQILFGPPGTGKTYQTISKAVDLINPGFSEENSREEVKAEFERLEQEGKVNFTTFHQSMTYEDFIEGIKPRALEDNEETSIDYEVKDGLFKSMAFNAAFSLVKEDKPKSAATVLDFSEAYENLVQDIEEKFSEEKDFTLQSKTGKALTVDHITNKGNIAFKNPGSKRHFIVSKERLAKIQDAFQDSDINAIDNINQSFRKVIGGHNATIYWAVLNVIRSQYFTAAESQPNWESYDYEARKKAVQELKKEDLDTTNGEPHILIIDEINRGNIAEIFGELITLVEDDKRMGKEEALAVHLPYSREKFAVPPNLFIIGTMNTADRSVEALDTALRRRFTFKEIEPEATKIGEVMGDDRYLNLNGDSFDLEEFLKTINGRIEQLLDKDHRIGHSYFLQNQDLRKVFQNHIIPLLQEHFFEDYGKIGLILGPGFVKPVNNKMPLANFNHEAREAIEEQPVYRLENIEAMNDDTFKNALNQLLNKESNESEK